MLFFFPLSLHTSDFLIAPSLFAQNQRLERAELFVPKAVHCMLGTGWMLQAPAAALRNTNCCAEKLRNKKCLKDDARPIEG